MYRDFWLCEAVIGGGSVCEAILDTELSALVSAYAGGWRGVGG